jgi:hypothetical protein
MYNKTTLAYIVCAVAVFLSSNLYADKNLVEPPSLPEPLKDGESIEPEVNIIQKDDRTIEEYRRGGELYMVKVVPEVGKPYYLLDTDGDGVLETKQFNLQSDEVPNWILLKW